MDISRTRARRRIVDRRLALLGLSALVLGSIVYVVDRPAGNLGLIPETLNLYGRTPLLFGSLGQQLPAFTHVFAFSLLIAALTEGSHRAVLATCLACFVVESALEVGQHTVIARAVGGVLADRDTGWLGRSLLEFLQRGHFDSLDMVAICLGSILAYTTIRTLSSRREGWRCEAMMSARGDATRGRRNPEVRS